MHEVMAQTLALIEEWLAEPEVSYSIYGERGVIDILPGIRRPARFSSSN
jgi:hypothetical protein